MVHPVTPSSGDGLREEVAHRFGVLPNFFCTASSVPGLTAELWAFAKSAYLDNPLPSLFKERLFVHLSRFCEVRYCIVRHVGFLIGAGRPAGDANARALSLSEVLRLLQRPVPDVGELEREADLDIGLERFELPLPDTDEEALLFDALTVMFLSPSRSDRTRDQVRKLVGDRQFELLTAFLAFVRTAHYWSETHPELDFEPDMVAYMDEHPELASLLLDTRDAEAVSAALQLRKTLVKLARTETALRASEAKLRKKDIWLSAQKEAFQASMNGASLQTSLGVLVDAVTEWANDGRRCAFYIADDKGATLTHVVGMPESYANAVDGFAISPESISCGLAVATGKPVITPDVLEDAGWQAWTWLARDHNYRGCWSFPIETSAGKLVGSFAFYFVGPRVAEATDYELAAVITQAAAIIISRYQENEDRIRAETALQEWNKRLEARVAEEMTARECAQATLQQAQRLDALGQLAGGVAHDFNNVLQCVQSAARIIEQSPYDATRVLKLSRRIGEASERGTSITRRLLTFSRKGDLRAEPVNAVNLLDGVKEILSHSLGTGITVEVRAEDDLPLLFVDKAQLETVLVNLATNARDAMKDMGTLVLDAALDIVTVNEPEPLLSPLRPGSYIRVSTIDTGSGMSKDVLAHASEPFFTTKPPGNGTGLGLAMARGFAEQSGGRMTIESAPGQGTTVRLWIPVAQESAVDVDAHARSGGFAATEKSRPRVLLIDDDDIVRETLAEELCVEGCAVFAAASGEEALALVDAGESIDLVITDLSMPNMDGLTVIREVRRRRPQLPTILLTGFAKSMSGIDLDAPENRAVIVLRKPLSFGALAEQLRMALGE